MATTHQIHSRWTTPQLLQGGLGLLWSLSLLLLLTALLGVAEQRQAIQTIGKDAAPSIIAAQHIRAGLADMDANAANELLDKPGQNQEAVKTYEARLQEVVYALVTAAENITYGDAERVPIQTLLLGLTDYVARVQQARDFHANGVSAMLPAYRAAAEIIDKTLMPAAEALDKANLAVLDRTYTAKRSAALRYVVLVIVSTLSLLTVLVVVQVFLTHRMHRVLNPMLVLATAITLCFGVYTIQALLSTTHHLKVAKEDAFTSIHALWQARALAYSANADESRYLLDSAQAQRHETAFVTKAAKLAQVPAGQSFESVAAAAGQGKLPAQFTGYLADELRNITFAGERAAAVATLRAFGAYVALDKDIRRLEQNGQHQAAITLCTSNSRGGSNWAFNQFDAALGKTLEINQQAFNAAVARGFKAVAGFAGIAPVVVVGIALCALFGLLPRLREYAV